MPTEAFEVKRHNRVAFFRLPARPMYFSYDLQAFDSMLLELDHCGSSDSVGAIIVQGPTIEDDTDEFEDFYLDVVQRRSTLRLNRMLNKYNQLVLAIIDLPKLVVFCTAGRVTAQTFNIGLACDYRIAADDMEVDRAYLRHGLVPKGGGVYFLAKLVGKSTALRLLLGDGDLSAKGALKLGLVDEVVAPDRLEAASFSVARKFATLPAATVSGVKQLMGLGSGGLAAHLSLESKQIQRCVGSAYLGLED